MTAPSVAAVVDTNVLISVLIGRRGPPAEILDALRCRRFSLVVSKPLLDELRIVTLRAELSRRFAAEDLVDLWLMIEEGATIVTPISRAPVSDDPVDDALFATALAGRACVVSGDRRVLELSERVSGISAFSPRAFLERLARH